MMQHTPLQFLRHDMKKNKSKKGNAPAKMELYEPFQAAYHVPEQSKIILYFCWDTFIMEMLAMAVGMLDTLDYYKSNTDGMMFAKYQYVLKSYVDEEGNIVSTGNKDAEKFDMTSLLKKSDALDEEVSIYGIADNSSYVKINDFDSLKKTKYIFQIHFHKSMH